MEDAMHHSLNLTVFAAGLAIALAAPAAAAENDTKSGPASGGVMQSQPSGVVTADQKPKLDLSDQQKQTVIKLIVERKTHQATPPEFKAELGASVPRKVDLHGMPPNLASDVPALKEYMYAHLDNEIAIVNALDKKVAALIPLPAELAHQRPAVGPAGQFNGDGRRPQTIGSGQPTADPLREREESGKPSAYTGPSTTK
jgi:hypothetical protein